MDFLEASVNMINRKASVIVGKFTRNQDGVDTTGR